MSTRVHDNGTLDSGSITSDLTALEEGTDDLGRRMILDAREDKRRVAAVTGNVRAFRKARPHPRVRERLEDQEHIQVLGLLAGQQRSASPYNSSSEGSDPPLRPPREWGRRGRHNREWLRRIDLAQEEETPRVAPHSPQHVDWTATAADVPLPSVEGSSPFRASTQNTPPSIRQRNSSLDKIREWELTEDFTMGSIVASTPAPAVWTRNTVLEDIREREMEGIEEEARVEEPADGVRTGSPEILRRQPSSTASARAEPLPKEVLLDTIPVNIKESEIKLPKRPASSASKRRSSSAVGDEAPNSPIIVYKSTESVAVVDTNIQAKAPTSPQRPSHKRQDSRDLLRQLARATSNSPSPTPPRMIEPVTGATVSVSNPSKDRQSSPLASKKPAEAEQSGLIDRIFRSPTKKKKTATFASEQSSKAVPDATADALSLSTADRSAGTLQEPVTKSSLAQPHTAGPSAAIEQSLVLKTPKVTGAWVDTPVAKTAPRPRSVDPPAAARDVSEPSRPRSSASAPPPEVKKPELPASALTSLIRTVKSTWTEGQQDDAFGESTIESLQDLVTEQDNSTHLNLDEDTLQNIQMPTGAVRTETERQRQRELQALQSMNARLRSTRTSIRDATRGLRRVEEQFNEVDVASSGHDGPCQRCGCPANGRFATMPFAAPWLWWKNLFYYTDKNGKGRLTWFGLIALSLIFWYISETALCEIYCQPLYAWSMEDYGVEPDAPRHPWVVLWFLTRPFSWLHRPLLSFLRWFLALVFQSLMSDDSAVDTRGSSWFGAEKVRTATISAARYATTTARTYMQASPSEEVVMGFGDDEYI